VDGWTTRLFAVNSIVKSVLSCLDGSRVRAAWWSFMQEEGDEEEEEGDEKEEEEEEADEEDDEERGLCNVYRVT